MMARSDDTDRFHAELWPHRALVLRMANLLTHNESDAEDLAQEVMLKAFNGLARLAPQSSPKAWLLTILRHAHVDRMRARHNGELSLDTLQVEPAADAEPEDLSAWDDPRQAMAQFSDQQVIAALKRLPEEIRWTLLLVDVQNIDDAEAADVLSVPVGTIKSRLHRGRRMLRELLLPLARARRLVPTASQNKKRNN